MNGFIYKWTNSKNNLSYIGKHIGVTTDGYIGSGTVFKNAYNKNPEVFSRTILWESNNTTDDELSNKEESYLSNILDEELYYGSNRKYYNQVKNSHGFTSANNPMKHQQVIDRMMATRSTLDTCKSIWVNVVEKHGYETACIMNSAKMTGNTNGSGNKGKTKSNSHKSAISESIIVMYAVKKEQGCRVIGKSSGRPRAVDYAIIVQLVADKGKKAAAKELGIIESAMHSRYYSAKKALKSVVK